MRKNYFLFILAILFTMNTMAQNIPSYVPKDNLVGYWPFNGNANDESGNENHGTVNGATLTADRNGVANSAYSFEGNQWIEVANSKSIQPIDAFTLSAWVLVEPTQPSLNDNYTRIISKNQAEPQNFATYQLITGLNTEYGKTGVCIRTGSGLSGNGQGVYNWTGPYSMNILKTYQHVVGTYNGSELSFFQNGKLMNTLKHSGKLFYDDGKLWFGRGLGTTNDSKPIDSFFSGQLDDIAIYNRALSEQEVQQLYAGCSKETATSSNFNTLIYTNDAPVNLSATPTGGSFSGNGVANNSFNPSKAKLGKNQVKYNFKNTTGCKDSTDFTMLVVDTVGATCIKYDTVKVNKYDTLKVTKFDTVTVKNNIYDTVTIKNNVFDTVKVTKYDTVTVTNNVTKYDTVIVKTNVFDTVKVNKYDTIIVTNNVTKYDTVKVTKFDTITVTNNVTKYDTVIVNKTNYDTVSILKIKFKLTTGIHANQLSSLSIYPNPTSDVLHIEVPDAKALEGYRYRIVDALGKEVYNQLVTQSTTEIPLKTLGAAGIYQFEILDAKNASIQSNKIVLQ